MRFPEIRRGAVALIGFVVVAACQGNMGATPPVTPAGGYTPSSQTAASLRGQSVNATATVTLSPDTEQLAFPVVGGFGLTIQLHSPAPTPLPTSASKHGNGKKKPPTPSPTATPAPPSPSPSPLSLADQASLDGAQKGKKKKGGGKSSVGVSQHFVDLTLTAYPDGAPDAPTAAPSTPPVLIRHALVRGDFHAQDAVTLPSLSVLTFALAQREESAGRGFSVAIFEQLKHRKSKQIAADVNASEDASGKVRVPSTAPAVPFEADHHYAIILYADDLAPKAPPAAIATPGALTSAPPGSAISPGPSSSPAPTNAALQGATLIR